MPKSLQRVTSLRRRAHDNAINAPAALSGCVVSWTTACAETGRVYRGTGAGGEACNAPLRIVTDVVSQVLPGRNAVVEQLQTESKPARRLQTQRVRLRLLATQHLAQRQHHLHSAVHTHDDSPGAAPGQMRCVHLTQRQHHQHNAHSR